MIAQAPRRRPYCDPLDSRRLHNHAPQLCRRPPTPRRDSPREDIFTACIFNQQQKTIDYQRFTAVLPYLAIRQKSHFAE